MKRAFLIITTLAVMFSIHFLYSRREGALVHDRAEGPALSDVNEIFPDASSVISEEGEAWTGVYEDRGILIGRVISTSPHADHIKGYAGATPLLIGIDLSGEIVGVHALDSKETPAFVKSVVSSGFLGSFDGVGWKKAAVLEVDTVTGATMTSDAMGRSIRHALSLAEGADTPPRQGYGIDDVLILVLVLAALVVCLFPFRRHQVLRLVILGISTVYLGFIRAEMLSMQVIAGWVKRGVVTYSCAALLIMAVVTVAVSLFKGKAFYCYYICPFGGLQEFAGRLSPWNVRLSAGTFRLLRKFRYALLVLIAMLLLAGQGKDLTGFEPFTVFAFRSAGITVLVIAGVSLVLSLFVGRPWCTFLCPTGALLDIFRIKSTVSFNFSRPDKNGEGQ
jgi:NosR/NirI family transcriptional regulator, nitrous oxide reductase regulator